MGDCVGWWGRRRLTGANLRAWIVGVCRFAEPGRVGTPCFCGGVKSASLVARMGLRAAFCGGGGAGGGDGWWRWRRGSAAATGGGDRRHRP